MGQISAKLRSVGFGGSSTGIGFWCPGCEEFHAICTNAPVSNRPVWQWDGNADAPTVSPSIRVTGKRALTDDEHRRVMAGEKIEIPDRCCHSFVRGGMIEFCGDSTHALANRSVPLPDLPSHLCTGEEGEHGR